jgi:hypothetical protein
MNVVENLLAVVERFGNTLHLKDILLAVGVDSLGRRDRSRTPAASRAFASAGLLAGFLPALLVLAHGFRIEAHRRGGCCCPGSTAVNGWTDAYTSGEATGRARQSNASSSSDKADRPIHCGENGQ